MCKCVWPAVNCWLTPPTVIHSNKVQVIYCMIIIDTIILFCFLEQLQSHDEYDFDKTVTPAHLQQYATLIHLLGCAVGSLCIVYATTCVWVCMPTTRSHFMHCMPPLWRDTPCLVEHVVSLVLDCMQPHKSQSVNITSCNCVQAQLTAPLSSEMQVFILHASGITPATIPDHTSACS